MNEPLEPRDLAAEYVLGVLDAEERRRAAARVISDPAFANEVSAWEVKLAPLASAITPVPPAGYVWERIRAALGHVTAARPSASTEPSLWRRIDVWRWLAGAGLALAAASSIALFLGRSQPLQPPSAAPLVAVMASDAGAPSFIATIDLTHGTLIVTPVAVWTDPQHVPQLWLIQPGGKPQSLGVLTANKALALEVPGDMRSGIGTTSILAVSVEPLGGSPTGQPTGAVIAKGQVSAI